MDWFRLNLAENNCHTTFFYYQFDCQSFTEKEHIKKSTTND